MLGSRTGTGRTICRSRQLVKDDVMNIRISEEYAGAAGLPYTASGGRMPMGQIDCGHARGQVPDILIEIKTNRGGKMLTRRNFVTGAIVTGVLMPNLPGQAKASQPATPVNFEIPPHACDCHTHFYGDVNQFPLSPQHLYTPEPLQPGEMLSLHRALHMERVVIVTPSVYGPNNNGATQFGLKARGANARGIAVVDDKTQD